MNYTHAVNYAVKCAEQENRSKHPDWSKVDIAFTDISNTDRCTAFYACDFDARIEHCAIRITKRGLFGEEKAGCNDMFKRAHRKGDCQPFAPQGQRRSQYHDE